MFRFLKKLTGRSADSSHLDHNRIDATIMARILGMDVRRNDFTLEEDRSRAVADGVIWRRRRFRFRVVDEKAPEGERPEGLCINEITMDSDAHAEITPAVAADYAHLTDISEIENAYWATTFAAGALRQAGGKRESRLYMNMAPILFGNPGHDRRHLLEQLAQLKPEMVTSLDPHELFDALEHHFISQNDGKFGLARYLPAFPVSRLVQADQHIIAGANAGYFLNFPEEYDDGVSALHQPVGGHLAGVRLLMPPWIERPGLLHFRGGATQSRLFGPEDMELHIEGLAPLPLRRGIQAGAAHATVWRFFDPIPEPPAGAVALHFSGNFLAAIEPASRDKRPLLGGGSIWITGEHAGAALQDNAIARIRLRLREFSEGTPEWMVSAGPFLVRGSEAIAPEVMLTPGNAGEFGPGGANSPPPTRFPFDTGKTRAPRTAFGSLPSGGFKIAVVDGRRSGEHSCGVSLEGLATLMQWLGCESAINLDGGGSSVMVIEGATHEDMLRENSSYGVVNVPSDDNGRERIVPIMLLVRARRDVEKA